MGSCCYHNSLMEMMSSPPLTLTLSKSHQTLKWSEAPTVSPYLQSLRMKTEPPLVWGTCHIIFLTLGWPTLNIHFFLISVPFFTIVFPHHSYGCLLFINHRICMVSWSNSPKTCNFEDCSKLEKTKLSMMAILYFKNQIPFFLNQKIQLEIFYTTLPRWILKKIQCHP